MPRELSNWLLLSHLKLNSDSWSNRPPGICLKKLGRRFSIPQAFHRPTLKFSNPAASSTSYSVYRTPTPDASVASRSLFRPNSALRDCLESGAVLQKRQMDSPRRTVALFSNNDLRPPLQIRIILLVNLFAKNEHHQVSILLNRPRLAQIRKLRTMIAPTALRRSAQLRKRNHRHQQLLGQRLQPARNRRHFLRPVLVALASARHQLQIINNDQIQLARRLLQPPRLGPHLAQRNTGSIVNVNRRVRQLFHRAHQFFRIVLPQ